MVIKLEMAHKSQIMELAEFGSEENQVALEAKFVNIWCFGGVISLTSNGS